MEEKNTRRTPAENRRPLQNLCLCALLIGVVLLFALLGLCLKDRTFSESENRSLAQFPQFSFAALADGSFFSDLSGYVADQFPARDTWMSVNFALNKTLGAKESSGVYLGKDNYLMQVPTAPNEEQLARNLYAMNCFAEAYPDLNTVAVIVPNAVTVLADKLPKNAPVRDQAADLAHIGGELTKVDMVDVTEALTAHAAEPLFYRTDHHWTSLAAAYAFEAIAPALDIKAPALESYTRYPVSTTFEGTLSSKSGSHAALDTVEIYIPHT
ncbi:MAG: hypothetical protein IIY16_01005, partial [Oscillospiraceae bacterium]|nr:hypothetical protein [Oscillospiraceae bacterium]